MIKYEVLCSIYDYLLYDLSVLDYPNLGVLGSHVCIYEERHG